MRWLMAGCTLMMLAMTSAHADTLSMERTTTEQTFVFGDVSIKRTYDAMKDPAAPTGL